MQHLPELHGGVLLLIRHRLRVGFQQGLNAVPDGLVAFASLTSSTSSSTACDRSSMR
jgi:hypothetical protein